MATDLSTPQKILRDSIRKNFPDALEPNQFNSSSTPIQTPVLDGERQKLVAVGRASLEQRRRQIGMPTASASSSYKADEEDAMEVDSSTTDNLVRKKSKGKGKKDEGDELYKPEAEYETDDDEVHIKQEGEDDDPKAKGRRISKRQQQKEKKAEESEAKKRSLKSRFIEGSMRDRPSVPPPREYTGSGSSNDDEEFRDDEVKNNLQNSSIEKITDEAARNEKDAKRNSRLGFLSKLNPFAFADNVRAAWVRQKKVAEERERRKAYEARQKKRMADYQADSSRYNNADEYKRQYQIMKERGEFNGGMPPSLVMAGAVRPRIAQAVTTNNGGNWASMTASARKRKRGELNSVSSSMDAPEFSYDSDNGQEGHLQYSEEYDSENSPVVPPVFAGPSTQPSSTEHTPAPPTTRTIHLATEPKAPRQSLLNKTSEVFNSTFQFSSSNATLPHTVGSSGRPLTKREIRKAERLQKKVSDLEDKLIKARMELQAAIPPPPVPPVRAELMPPPPVPRLTPVSTNDGSSAHTLIQPPATPFQQTGPAHREVYLDNNDADFNVGATGDETMLNGEEPVENGGDITMMDEGFSMIPLSPVLNSSILGIDSNVVGNGQATSGTGFSPAPKAPATTATASKILDAKTDSNDGIQKPERKKRKGMYSPPPKKGSSEDETIPPVPSVPKQ